MSLMPWKFNSAACGWCLTATCALFTQYAQASVVSSHTLGVSTSASVEASSDSDTAPAPVADSGTLSSAATGSTGNSTASITWSWDGTELVSTGVLDTTRTTNSGPPQLYTAQVDLTFDFTLSAAATYDLGGSLGFTNAVDAGDLLQVQVA